MKGIKIQRKRKGFRSKILRIRKYAKRSFLLKINQWEKVYKRFYHFNLVSRQNTRRILGKMKNRHYRSIYTFSKWESLRRSLPRRKFLAERLEFLLCRLIFRLRVARSIDTSKQLILHGRIIVNGNIEKNPYRILQPGDVVRISSGVKKPYLFRRFIWSYRKKRRKRRIKFFPRRFRFMARWLKESRQKDFISSGESRKIPSFPAEINFTPFQSVPGEEMRKSLIKANWHFFFNNNFLSRAFLQKNVGTPIYRDKRFLRELVKKEKRKKKRMKPLLTRSKKRRKKKEKREKKARPQRNFFRYIPPSKGAQLDDNLKALFFSFSRLKRRPTFLKKNLFQIFLENVKRKAQFRVRAHKKKNTQRFHFVPYKHILKRFGKRRYLLIKGPKERGMQLTKIHSPYVMHSLFVRKRNY